MELIEIIDYAIAFFSLFVVNVFILIFLKHKDDYLKIPEKTTWEPTISIVLPAYNEGLYIRDSINSLLELDYPKEKLEILVVDDGSTDDTLKIVKEFEEKAIHVFTKKNGGKGAALNFGIKNAKGELIVTMDADSYVEKSTLKELLPLFSDPLVMAVTPAVKIRESKSAIKELQRVEYLLILFSRKLLSFIDSVPVTPGPFSIFRKSVFEEIGLFDEHNLVEDQEIALRIQSKNFKIKSSLTAEVYTEPPSKLGELIKQRVRWQRGGIRNYWKYRNLIKPEYGDFGLYFIPLNFATLSAFFLVFGLMIYSILASPYYVRYIWTDLLGFNIGLFTFVGFFVIITSIFFTVLSVNSFKNEKVSPLYMVTFIFFYWYLMVAYNLIFAFKELKQEGYSW